MAKFKFIGNPNKANEGPDTEFEHRGYKFTKGKVTDVPDTDTETIERLTTNNHYERTDGPKADKPPAHPYPTQAPQNQTPRKEDPNNENPKGMDHPRSPAPGRP